MSSFQLAGAVARQFREKEALVEKSEQRGLKEARRVCGQVAKMVREFWMNVEKVVDARAQVTVNLKETF